MANNKFFNNEEIDDSNYSQNQESNSNGSNTSFDSHGNSMDEYSDQIFIGDNNTKEVMFDRKNPIVKLFLFVLGLIAFGGTIYYIYIFFTTMWK